MKTIYKKGDKKYYTKTIDKGDLASFHGELLHEVYSTFALARDMEWSSRLFFIDMKDFDEEGVGTHLEVQHLSPAFQGQVITFVATVDSIERNELICNIEVSQGNKLIALGKTGQRMLKKEKLNRIFTPPSKHE